MYKARSDRAVRIDDGDDAVRRADSTALHCNHPGQRAVICAIDRLVSMQLCGLEGVNAVGHVVVCDLVSWRYRTRRKNP